MKKEHILTTGLVFIIMSLIVSFSLLTTTISVSAQTAAAETELKLVIKKDTEDEILTDNNDKDHPASLPKTSEEEDKILIKIIGLIMAMISVRAMVSNMKTRRRELEQ